MKIKIHFLIFWILILVFVMLSSCSSLGTEDDQLSDEAQIQTSVAETLTAIALMDVSQTPAEQPLPTVQLPTDTQTAEVTPSETTAPTITPSPTISLTPMSEKPMVSVSLNTNCRTGPGTIYDYIGGLLVGEQAEVVGRFGDGAYWVIKNPDRPGECWLWGEYATVTGSTSQLPEYSQPPTPTPTSTSTSTATPTQTATITLTPTITVTATP